MEQREKLKEGRRRRKGNTVAREGKERERKRSRHTIHSWRQTRTNECKQAEMASQKRK